LTDGPGNSLKEVPVRTVANYRQEGEYGSLLRAASPGRGFDSKPRGGQMQPSETAPPLVDQTGSTWTNQRTTGNRPRSALVDPITP